jgi:hypothetical protein
MLLCVFERHGPCACALGRHHSGTGLKRRSGSRRTVQVRSGLETLKRLQRSVAQPRTGLEPHLHCPSTARSYLSQLPHHHPIFLHVPKYVFIERVRRSSASPPQTRF